MDNLMSDEAVTNLQLQPEIFLQPSKNLHSSFTQLAKRYLDPVATDVTEFQVSRQKLERQNRKRKRRQHDVGREAEDLLRMRQVHVGGFDIEQIWQQARRVLNATADEIENQLRSVERITQDSDLSRKNSISIPGGIEKRVQFAEQQQNLEDSDVDENNLGEEGVDWEYDGVDVSEEEEDGGVGLDRRLAEAEDNTSDHESLDIGDDTAPSDISDEVPTEILVKDKFGLNDGFFSIDQFNKHSQFLEQVDARGEEDDGAASDEEDIDWAVDPMTATYAEPISMKSRRTQRKEDEDSEVDATEESDGSEDGPTFGNMDLNASEGDSDVDEEYDEGDMSGDDFNNTNDIMYNDFFAPPARQPNKKKKLHLARLKELGKNNSRAYAATEAVADEDDAAMERTMSRVHQDLFEDDLSDDPDGQVAEQNPKDSNLSSHERRQLALREEIRRLEAANVSAKPWSLAGESVAPSRPINSLLEEDLDFERAGKPVPVITEEVSEDIEALIKRRILAREFDEVTRRRPTDLIPGGASADPRRGRVNEPLSDAKPQKGLADEYAEDHLRATDPAYVDTRTAALRAAHKSIEAHWTAVSAQLDALCNWHYKPKPIAPSLEVRTDAPTITIEDARPAAAEGDAVGEGMLAPQEVWNKGMEGKKEGEVVTKGGGAVAREEETREQKLRRRRREKERIRKAGGGVNGAAIGGQNGKAGSTTRKVKETKGTNRKGEEADVIQQLKRGGVKVIGKKGAVTDVDGVALKNAQTNAGGAGKFKL